MAEEAVFGAALEARMVARHLLHRVEDRPQGGIGDRHLDHFPGPEVADVHVVIEIERAGVAGADPRLLEARLGEDERLARGWHLERSKDTPQPTD